MGNTTSFEQGPIFNISRDGNCLENGALLTPGGTVAAHPCVKGANHQAWKWTGDVNKRGKLCNLGSNKCLSLDGNRVVATRTGTDWLWDDTGRICDRGVCLDHKGDGNLVVLIAADTTANQVWKRSFPDCTVTSVVSGGIILHKTAAPNICNKRCTNAGGQWNGMFSNRQSKGYCSCDFKGNC